MAIPKTRSAELCGCGALQPSMQHIDAAQHVAGMRQLRNRVHVADGKAHTRCGAVDARQHSGHGIRACVPAPHIALHRHADSLGRGFQLAVELLGGDCTIGGGVRACNR
jgi:hypothetical protein